MIYFTAPLLQTRVQQFYQTWLVVRSLLYTWCVCDVILLVILQQYTTAQGTQLDWPRSQSRKQK